MSVVPVLSYLRLAGRPGHGDLVIVGAGLGTTVETLWSRTATVLAERFEVIGVDLPGHGRSAPVAAGFTIADLATSVRRLADVLDIAGRRCWYAGVSLAGAVGFALGLHPGRLSGVIALAAASTFGTPQAWCERAALVRRHGTRAVVAGSRERWFAPGFTDRDPVAERMLDELVQVDGESYALCCEALADYDLRVELPDITVPVLVVPGALDVVVPPARAAEDAASVAGARMRVAEGCGHQPPVETPDVIADVVRSFVDQNAEEGSTPWPHAT